MIDYEKSPRWNATRMINGDYGARNWRTGCGEYSKIIK